MWPFCLLTLLNTIEHKRRHIFWLAKGKKVTENSGSVSQGTSLVSNNYE